MQTDISFGSLTQVLKLKIQMPRLRRGRPLLSAPKILMEKPHVSAPPQSLHSPCPHRGFAEKGEPRSHNKGRGGGRPPLEEE